MGFVDCCLALGVVKPDVRNVVPVSPILMVNHMRRNPTFVDATEDRRLMTYYDLCNGGHIKQLVCLY